MQQDITMFFPAYNEEGNIKKLVKDAERVLKENANKYEMIIVLYEGSTDNTKNIIKELMKKNKSLRLVMQPKKLKGVGYAIKMGFDAAKYDLIFYADSDNQFDLNEFKLLLPYTKHYDIVAGYRINRQDPLTRIWVSRIYNILIKIIFNLKGRDFDCAFRLVKKKVFKTIKLQCKTGLGTSELLIRARRGGYKIKHVGVHHFKRYSGVSVFNQKGFSIPKARVIAEIIKEVASLKKQIKK
ncbi:glycosyl transferase [Candidatus Woesearchaeota archaeon]|jgi:glycosyltransferase involved in cell wall biosynthesis|nr:glycosyl transferase [Candidatus Woesearchaeota archaeon]